MITIGRFIERRSESQVAECLIFIVLSSSFNVSSLELRNKAKASQQRSLRGANDFVTNEVRVFLERVYADNVVSKFWIMRSLSSQHYHKLVANNTYVRLSRVCIKDCKTTSFICKINLICFWVPRSFLTAIPV